MHSPEMKTFFLCHLAAFYDVTKGTGTWLITPARCSFHTALFFFASIVPQNIIF